MIMWRKILFLLLAALSFLTSRVQDINAGNPDSVSINIHGDAVPELIIPTFLGNDQRNFYGDSAPVSLDLVWKHYLGKGITVISRKSGSREWAGAGWTGQPLLVKENGRLFLIQGAYDHHLKKIDAETGKLVWQYKFDDVVKGTGTLWFNNNDTTLKNRLVILQGSRLGVGNYLDSKHIPSYRAVSYFTGEELWRLDVKWTDSYSRDADGSALVINDTVYIGLENSLFTVMDPDYRNASVTNGMLQPRIHQELRLYYREDASKHKGNLVTESSPAILGDHIYVASGSGHVWGYNMKTRELDWDFFIGSDIDGSAVVTRDSCLLVSIEKQYIEGPGGLIKLDPSKPPAEAVVWFCPVGDKKFASWEGGIIGTAGVNDYYNVSRDYPDLAAFAAIDGYLYVVNHVKTDSSRIVKGFDNIQSFHPPEIVYKRYIGPSISTPLVVGNKIIVAGYSGLKLFQYDEKGKFELIAERAGTFESTPVVHQGRVYIASRDGYLYCLGEK